MKAYASQSVASRVLEHIHFSYMSKTWVKKENNQKFMKLFKKLSSCSKVIFYTGWFDCCQMRNEQMEKLPGDNVLKLQQSFRRRVPLHCMQHECLCVHGNISNSLALYLRPSEDPGLGEGEGQVLAAKPQGAGREQDRQQQVFHSFTYSFSHSFSPQERSSGEYTHRHSHSASFWCWVFSNKLRPQGKAKLEAAGLDTTFPVHSGQGLCQHLKCLWPQGRESNQRLQYQCGLRRNTCFLFSGWLRILHSCQVPKSAY